jgi:PAS domain S-box-containing protein
VLKKQPQHILSALVLVILVCLFYTCTNKSISRYSPSAAQNGVMDLHHWDFDKNGSVALKGEWEFYWKQLLTPDQFIKNKKLASKYINAPGRWNDFEIDGKKLSGIGFATYRLKVITAGKDLGLKLPGQSSSSKVYVNGRLICSSDLPVSIKKRIVPIYAPSVKAIENNSDLLEIVIHVYNYNYWAGGMKEAVYLGNASSLQAKREKNLVVSSMFFSAIWIIGFYHIIIFLTRKKDRSSLVFGAICLLEGFQTILLGERYFVTVFPTIEFSLYIKLVYGSMCSAVPLFILYMKTIFPDEASDGVVKAVLFAGSLFLAYALFSPSHWVPLSLPAFRVFTICLSFYGTVVLAMAVLNKRPGGIIFLIGYIILIVTVLNDIFYDRNSIPFGLFSFLFSQAFLISQRYSLAFSTIEQQGEALHIENRQREIAEYHLKKSEEKYREMIELLPIPFCEFDLSFNILYANKAALDWFGYTKKDYNSGINISCFLEDRVVDLAAIRKKAEGLESSTSSMELKLKKKDGSELWGHATFSIIVKNDKPFAFRCCFVDLSEQKKSQHKLAKYQEQLRELSSQISLSEERQRHSIAQGLHDQAGQSLVLIRMMLNEIADCTSLVHKNEKLANVVKIVDQTMNQIRELTFDLSPPELYQFGIEIALESLCERKSKSFNIPILFSYDKESKHLDESDCILIYQSARELLFNVFKHANATKISVSIKRNNNTIEVVVEDNGIGLDTDQLYVSKTKKGFGLFSIQERMHHRGGRFHIKSNKAKGTKATLSVSLKL